MRKNSNRMIRINEEIKKEITYIISTGIKDPRVEKMLTVVNVKATSDLKYCKVYISVMADEEKKKETIDGLNSAEGYIRKELAIRLNLRNTPEIKFILDDSIEYSIHMSKLLRNINASNGDEKDNEI